MKNLSKLFIIISALFSFAFPSFASSTFYVRTDGGTSTQCSGLADAAYPGNGKNQACAFNHPFWVLPPGRTPVMLGGDTLVISSGSYMMGAGAPNGIPGNSGPADVCNHNWPQNCFIPPIPSGPDTGHPTKIYGKNWDTKLTPAPELWGTQGAYRIFDLTTSNNVEIRYLEITDHSSCLYDSPNPVRKCNNSVYPLDQFAQNGIRATDSSNVLLKDINVHGLALHGIWAGRLTDWTIDGVIIRGNGNGAGWQGDVGEGAIGLGTDSLNHGKITFKNCKIEYSGCGEQYPTTTVADGCVGQDYGGNGDGIGTWITGGSWILDTVEISHNCEDGLDLLYHIGPNASLGGTVTIINSRFEGNAGNQVKVSTNTTIDNSVIIGNCDYFYNNPLSESYGGATMNFCRAGGIPLTSEGWGVTSNRPPNLSPGTSYITLTNSTLVSAAQNLIGVANHTESTASPGVCDGTQKFHSRNNLILGKETWYSKRFGSGGQQPTLFYNGGNDYNGGGDCGPSGAHPIQFVDKDSSIYNTAIPQCQNSNHVLCIDPQLTSISPLSSENIPPMLTIDPLANPTILSAQAISGTAKDIVAVISVKVQIGNGAASVAMLNGNNWSYMVRGLSAGQNIITVTALNSVGITTTKTISIVRLSVGNIGND